jgi:NAD(P)-dependent dehydrogenase (short-subunit alcohol dehydrogenase family)
MTVEQRLRGSIAIITGAGQGIGKAVAKRLAAEGAVSVIAEYNASNAAAAHEIANSGGKATVILWIFLMWRLLRMLAQSRTPGRGHPGEQRGCCRRNRCLTSLED